MAGEALYYGTGRRKNAVARVRLVPGTGKVTINGREALAYFGREALVNYALTPFKVTDTTDHFDVIATLNGAASRVRPARCATASPARCCCWRLPRRAQEGRLPHARLPYGGAQEVRPQEGTQAPAVLEALGTAARIREQHVFCKARLFGGGLFLWIRSRNGRGGKRAAPSWQNPSLAG